MQKHFLVMLFLIAGYALHSQQLFELSPNVQSRVSSFENLNGVKGNSGKTNATAKGNAFEVLKADSSKTLLNIQGEGIVQRIWLTIDQSPKKLRSIRLQMFWDGATKPAVDVPLGDFFCYNAGIPVAFESEFFSSAEGKSFNCYIPMPFRKGAKIVLLNEGDEPAKLFFDVDYTLQKLPANAMYFHAYWSRQSKSKLGDDFIALPTVKGKGRFLGMSIGLLTDSSYGNSWWGEGEVKMYMDGDTKYPTINGTGLEDYIGSAWGLGKFNNRYQGCSVMDDSVRSYAFYRFHVPDAIYFSNDIRVAIQQIGGWDKASLFSIIKKNALVKPVSIDGEKGFVRLMDKSNTISITDADAPDGWINFYRVDDYAAVSYFYLDKPVDNLPPLAPVNDRIVKR